MPDAPAPPLLCVPDATREAIASLVAKYRQNEDQYRSSAYNEAQCRREFIDPFFEALGWDVQNRAGNAEQYKEVIHEASLKVGEATKAPDYAFRIGGQRKFYVEAKKPSVPLHDEPTAAYQLRRYAWSAKLPLSILTDFDEFAVYDCRQRPNATDASAVGRVKFVRFHEYLDELDYLYSTFSPEAIRKGSFDRYVEDKRRHRGTAEVDAAFLAEIEGWRKGLAKDIARHNPGLSVYDLNFAVQATIDRILFFRIAEDRGVEEYGRLRFLLSGTRASLMEKKASTGADAGATASRRRGMSVPLMGKRASTGETPVPREGSIYAGLCRLYEEADAKYNAGLFDFGKSGDTLCPRLTISDKVLKPIVKGLYYPDCPYEFSVLGADILGAVYEQFLGKVIRLTPSGMAKVEEKPEVKKAGGVYYTPRYIVDYIVEHTVGEAIREAGTPEEVAKLRILDPACGSGSFLLGAYDYLLRWHLDYYTQHDPERFTRGTGVSPLKPSRRRRKPLARDEAPLIRLGDDWRLSSSERKRILLSNLYGVDLDPQAVEVTKLNLLLKCMEGDIWPGIARQMKLLHDRVLPNIDGNIKCGNSLIGWDYFDDRLDGTVDAEERNRVRPFDWQAEFRPIVEAGGFDCVIGNPPYGMVAEAALKTYFQGAFETTEGRFDLYELFLEQGVSLCRQGGLLGYIVPSPLLTNVLTRRLREHILGTCAIEEISSFGIDVFADPTVHTCIVVVRRTPGTRHRVRVRKQVNSIAELGGPYDYEVPQARLAEGPNATFDIFLDPPTRRVVRRMQAGSRTVGQEYFIRQCIKTGDDGNLVRPSESRMSPPWRPSLRGRSIDRYATRETDLYVKYGPWLARNWKNRSFYETPKLAVRETGNRIVATLDLDHRYFLSSLYAVYPQDPADPRSLHYLLGILNSWLATWFVKAVALDLTKGAFTKFRTNQLARLPPPHRLLRPEGCCPSRQDGSVGRADAGPAQAPPGGEDEERPGADRAADQGHG